MRPPKLNALRMFDAAARHLNFRVAAEELYLTQGAVAQQVRQLERALGVTLFNREARGLSLTPQGATYHEAVHTGLSIIDAATRKMGTRSRSVTASVPPSLASKWLVPRLHDFATLHPEVELHIIASERLADFVTDGVDVAIRQGLPRGDGALTTELLAPLRLSAVCSPALVEQELRISQLEDFVHYPLIQDAHRLWDALFAERGLSRSDRMLQFNQTSLAMDAAANGQGIALAPGLLLADDLDSGRLRELWRVPDTGRAGYYLMYPTRPDAARDTLVEWLCTQAAVDCSAAVLNSSGCDIPSKPSTSAQSRDQHGAAQAGARHVPAHFGRGHDRTRQVQGERPTDERKRR